uniref:Uncharacterized protein n=1 Tax=viral metagenome TaxID=1070528 RepID=A0A6C0BN28_9ZZZZ
MSLEPYLPQTWPLVLVHLVNSYYRDYESCVDAKKHTTFIYNAAHTIRTHLGLSVSSRALLLSFLRLRAMVERHRPKSDDHVQLMSHVAVVKTINELLPLIYSRLEYARHADAYLALLQPLEMQVARDFKTLSIVLDFPRAKGSTSTSMRMRSFVTFKELMAAQCDPYVVLIGWCWTEQRNIDLQLLQDPLWYQPLLSSAITLSQFKGIGPKNKYCRHTLMTAPKLRPQAIRRHVWNEIQRVRRKNSRSPRKRKFNCV